MNERQSYEQQCEAADFRRKELREEELLRSAADEYERAVAIEAAERMQG